MQHRSITSIKVLASTAAVAVAALAPAAHAGSKPDVVRCAWPAKVTPTQCIAVGKAPKGHKLIVRW
jgi:hypothetical protein